MGDARLHERLLVIVADDLGRSSSANSAIAEARTNGILTSASLMAGGAAFEEAVEMALDLRLSVGVHVTLCDGRSVLPHSVVPDLTDPDGQMERSPSTAWMRYMRHGILPQIEAEIEAQFERIGKAGIQASYVNGHHHLHMHPLVFDVVCRHALRRGISWIRFPAEPLPIILSLGSRVRGLMPFIEWSVFGMLSIYNSRTARKYGMRPARRVYGLSRTEDIDEGYLLNILSRIDSPVSELFAHPDADTEPGRRELKALTSDRVRRRLDSLGIRLAAYDELPDTCGQRVCGQDDMAFQKMRSK